MPPLTAQKKLLQKKFKNSKVQSSRVHVQVANSTDELKKELEKLKISFEELKMEKLRKR